MKQELLLWFQNPNSKAETVKELASRFHMEKGPSFQTLTKALFELERDGFIAKNKKLKYHLIETFKLIRGTIDLKVQGYGFVTPEGKDKGISDIFISKENTQDVMDNDQVLVKITKRTAPNRMEGYIERIIKRHLEFVVGEYHQGAVFPKKGYTDYLFKVKTKSKEGLVDHTLVKAKIIKVHSSRVIDVQIEEILGSIFDVDATMKEILANHQVEVDFPKDVLKQVQTIPSVVLSKEIEKRTDLRDKMIFTIDGDDTKDIDDAISIELTKQQTYLLGVHIADVSHYVQENTPLDQNAYLRGTSIYLADRVVPMLPKELSNGICSLNPGVDRLAISCEMEISKDGSILKKRFFPSVIHSHKQMTYKVCNEILARNSELRIEHHELVDTLELMEKLAKILREKRTMEGSINFETIEPKLIFNETGQVQDITLRERGVSERIIEEFMLIANQAVASFFMKKNLPFLYRIHDNPDQDKMRTLFQLAKEIGYVKVVPSVITPKDLQDLLLRAEDTEYEKVINVMMLRAMAKAKYSKDNVGHYGLAFEDYTHFTSPIRRYPDLIVHRLIRNYVFNGKTDLESKKYFDSILEDIGISTSKSERTAMIVEREVMDYKKAEYMQPQVGQVFEGIISSVTRFGLFVELPNTVEGLIHLSTFKEAMEYNEAHMTYLGITSRIVYNIGKIVKVRLLRSNPLLGQIDFEIFEERTKE